jgi:septal ring factor EnvC (AmiA/AmiB activator)
VKRAFALFLSLVLAGQAVAQEAGLGAEQAAQDLQVAIVALEAAESAQDRVGALTATIRAYEEGLSALRESLRQVRIRETALADQLALKRTRVSQLIGVLTQMENDPTPLLLLHPSGPLGTVRSGMLVADVAPAVQAEVETLRAELGELRDLRALQAAAGETLMRGLQSAQAARTALSQAVSDRIDLPRRFTDDPDMLRNLLESADTLDAFAAGLAPAADDGGAVASFASAKGTLPLPALGQILLRAEEADAAGVRRPGLTLGTRPKAILTLPWPATVRYIGPLLDYGNVIVLEPGDGYLLVLAGMETVYGALGEVLPAGSPLGLMGGGEPDAANLMAGIDEGSGVQPLERLYIELRQGARPVDPADWFELTAPPLRPRLRSQTEDE